MKKSRRESRFIRRFGLATAALGVFVMTDSSLGARAQTTPPAAQPAPEFKNYKPDDFPGRDPQKYPHFYQAIRKQMEAVKAKKYKCAEDAAAAIAWLDSQADYLSNLFVGLYQPTNDNLQAELRALSASLKKLPSCNTPEPPRTHFGPFPTLASANGAFIVPQNQIDLAGGFAFGAQSFPFLVGGNQSESLGPGNGPFGEITYHRGLSDHGVLWGVVSYTNFDRGPAGDFGSTQTATLWDNKLVVGWKDKCAVLPGVIYEYYGGIKYVGLDLTSRSSGGGSHTGSFSGAGPTVGLTLDFPIVPVSPEGTGGLMFNSYLEGAALFGTLNDSSNYGLSGSSSRTGFYTGELAGLSTKVAPNATLGVNIMARQYYNIVDKNLNVGGTSSANNFNHFVGAIKMSFSF